MRYSKLLGKTHAAPRVKGFFPGVNVLRRAGFVQLVGKGLVGWLPLGERVLRNLRVLLEQKVEGIGGQAASWPQLPPAKGGAAPELPEQSDEVAIEFIRSQVQSYKELPVFLYQFSKRNHATTGPPGKYRGSEVLLQKGFSLHPSFSSLNNFLPRIHWAFSEVLHACQLEPILIRESDDPVGPATRYSTSLLVLPSSQGGDCFFCSCVSCNFHQLIRRNRAHNLIRMEKDSNGEHCYCRICSSELEIRSGHVMARIQRVNSPSLKKFRLQRGATTFHPLGMKSEFYLTPLLFLAAEASVTSQGLLWPTVLSPFRALVMGIGSSSTARRFAESIQQSEANVLLDDRHVSISRKMRDFLLLGIPQAVVVSAQTLRQGKVDVIDRRTNTEHSIDCSSVGDFLAE